MKPVFCQTLSCALWGLVFIRMVLTPAAVAADFPGERWAMVTAAEAGLDAGQLERARDYAMTGGGSGYITRGGRLVLSWGDAAKRYDLKSTTKSFGTTALGLAVWDGKIALTDKVQRHHPSFGVPPQSNADTGWLSDITILHLATQTAGFEKPGGYEKLIFQPGTKWAYSDGGPNWLAECLTLAYRQDVDKLMFDRVFTPLGISRSDLVWRNNSYREKTIDGIPRREFGSGISASVDAMARVGLLYLRRGTWNDQRILPEEFVQQAGTTVPSVVGLPEVDSKSYGNASDHYGLLWWNNADGTLADVPRDAYWTWGLYDSLIVVMPGLDIVVARAGQSWKRSDGDEHYKVLEPFLGPIAAAAEPKTADRVFRPSPSGKPGSAAADSDELLERKLSSKQSGKSNGVPSAAPPYPPSAVITGIEWAPASTIIRRARGGDNWPMTWADDNCLYTAYGDGRGFGPYVDVKLSMGLSRITGPADNFTAENIRSSSFETKGDGTRGRKASGLLMVDGTLYLWARNAGNSQLAWSTDHGATWTWSDWKFTESFGAPTFLNFGCNYAGARDEFVYVYSHDSDSAYQPADRMVLARVPATRIRERGAYEYFAGIDSDGVPL
ncbi:MAG: serine hydrolase, partial [Planctomycetaceae bacterium]|nr:serine hydrolase [Planctomycetaceae bacterium]